MTMTDVIAPDPRERKCEARPTRAPPDEGASGVSRLQPIGPRSNPVRVGDDSPSPGRFSGCSGGWKAVVETLGKEGSSLSPATLMPDGGDGGCLSSSGVSDVKSNSQLKLQE